MNTATGKVRKARRVYQAREKAEAVLRLWAKRGNASRICKERAISWTVLNVWEKRALQGMLRGLGGTAPETPQGVLGQRLEKLLTEMTVMAEIKTPAPAP